MTWSATATVSLADVQRSNIVRERKIYPIPLTSMRVWDEMATLLPAAAANDDCGLITGVLASEAPTIQAGDIGGATSIRYFAFEWCFPPEYEDGQYVAIRASAGMVTSVCDTDCTLDFNLYEITRAGAVGADLVSTTAVANNMNSITHADIDFLVTATGLVAGDKVIVRGIVDYDDTGNLDVQIPEVVTVEMYIDIKG